MKCILKQWFFKIYNFFKKPEDEFKSTYITPTDLIRKSYNIVIPEMHYCQPEINGRPNVLIMDDFIGMAHLIKDEMHRIQCCDVYNEFNVLMATGNYAAFTVENFLKNTDKKVDVAILDITLGGVIDTVEYDGIDTAIALKKHNPNCVIRFITGHTLNKHNPEIFKFIQKFEDFFKTPMDETKVIEFKGEQVEMYRHIISKNGNRVAALGDLMQEYYDLQEALRS